MSLAVVKWVLRQETAQGAVVTELSKLVRTGEAKCNFCQENLNHVRQENWSFKVSLQLL